MIHKISNMIILFYNVLISSYNQLMNRLRQHLDLFHNNVLPLESNRMTHTIWVRWYCGFMVFNRAQTFATFILCYDIAIIIILLFNFQKASTLKYSLYSVLAASNVSNESSNSDKYNSEFFVHIFYVNYFQSKWIIRTVLVHNWFRI